MTLLVFDWNSRICSDFLQIWIWISTFWKGCLPTSWFVQNTRKAKPLKRTKQTLKFNGWIPEIVEDSNPKLPFYAPWFLESTYSLNFQAVYVGLLSTCQTTSRTLKEAAWCLMRFSLLGKISLGKDELTDGVWYSSWIFWDIFGVATTTFVHLLCCEVLSFTEKVWGCCKGLRWWNRKGWDYEK